jgi:hypothetical protein
VAKIADINRRLVFLARISENPKSDIKKMSNPKRAR